jgi:hypothetical protein
MTEFFAALTLVSLIVLLIWLHFRRREDMRDAGPE